MCDNQDRFNRQKKRALCSVFFSGKVLGILGTNVGFGWKLPGIGQRRTHSGVRQLLCPFCISRFVWFIFLFVLEHYHDQICI